MPQDADDDGNIDRGNSISIQLMKGPPVFLKYMNFIL